MKNKPYTITVVNPNPEETVLILGSRIRTTYILFHIISHGKKWCVKKAGATRATKIFTHRDEAFFYARSRSNHVVVHNKDGSVCFVHQPLLK